MSSKGSSFLLPFVKKIQLTNDVFSFYFDRTSNKFNFYPGQFIRMVLPCSSPDERGALRFFTISSSPLIKKYITITTKIGRSTFKKTLANLRQEQRVQFFGPMGQFLLKVNSDPVVFLAGGMGITPFHSMISYAVEKKLHKEITLLASFTRTEEIIFLAEFKKMMAANNFIKVIYTVTRSNKSDANMKFEAGRITANFIMKCVPEFTKKRFYIAGPPEMVSDLENTLMELNVSGNKILSKEFSGY